MALICTKASELMEYQFTPDCLKQLDEPPVFRLKPLDGKIALMVSVDLNKGELSVQGVNIALSQGLKGWDGVEDENGKPLEFTLKNVDDYLPQLVKIQLAEDLAMKAYMPEAARKNS